MTALWLLLVLLVPAPAEEAWRTVRQSSRKAGGLLGRRYAVTVADLEILFHEAPERYAHFDRLLGNLDYEFLARSRGGSHLAGALGLRPCRARTMALYLNQISYEFDRLMTVALWFAAAPTAQSAKSARQLARQWLRFHVLLASLRLKTYVNYLFRCPVEMGRLIQQIDLLRRSASRIMGALTPADLGALTNLLRNH